jgi:hypothetical protein
MFTLSVALRTTNHGLINIWKTDTSDHADMVLGFSGQVTTANGGLPVGVTNSTLTWPEFTGPDAKTCRVGED